MRLWTLQPIEVLDEIEKTGRFVCDKSMSENLKDNNFIFAYDWLVGKMEEKVGERPNGVVYPVWAWHTWDWKHTKPDLRRYEFWEYGKDKTFVCIEFEIPDEKVVLSDEGHWTTFVLNHDYFDSSLNEEEWEEQHEWFDKLRGKEREETLIKSFDRVFDVEPFENDWVTTGRYVQATFWELKKEYIRKVVPFKGRASRTYN